MTSVATAIGLHEIRMRWGWFLALGILLIGVGFFALTFTPAATLGTVLVLGWLVAFSGVLEGVFAFHARRWTGVLLHVLGCVLGIFLGLMVVTHPVAGALAWTLLFASYFTVIGIFRTIAALHLKYKGWGWAVFDGLVTFVLGILLWLDWPASAIWFIGFALGIAMILRGWTMIMFAFAIRSLNRSALSLSQQVG